MKTCSLASSPFFTVAFSALLALSTAACSSSSAPQSGGGDTSGAASSGSSSGGSSSSSGSPAGGSSSSGSSPGGSSGGGSTPAALTCLTRTFCSSKSVAIYKGQTTPALSGGTIADGLYRLGYELQADGAGMTPDGDSGEAFLIQGGTYLMLGLGELGTLAVADSKLTLTPTYGCDSPTGTQGTAGGDVLSYTYGVDAAGSLLLQYSPGSPTKVFVKVEQLCGGPDSQPSSPGDSFTCHVQNCGCAENTGAAADADTCKYVSGN